ncbi:hypothetical protein [Sulfitobacter guttiformis]|uniref:Uncharacterized protein n=2 Tax=Sulfitobacter guttiformis TaxID=74349 RepID=A0A420DHC4_9RHOB|nr:hypothetical protein [Sulfitobacter guttiformis]KIN72645.1 hypothetical protein Z949_1823 [Sulfitobacter guttiformis KCTC 32187]RKE93625.1 hypothetical protein C8N30_2702 [Sulfitobacter guttiformis]
MFGEWALKFIGDIFFIIACAAGFLALILGLATAGDMSYLPYFALAIAMMIPHFVYRNFFD